MKGGAAIKPGVYLIDRPVVPTCAPQEIRLYMKMVQLPQATLA